jgi:hypothetical protein
LKDVEYEELFRMAKLRIEKVKLPIRLSPHTLLIIGYLMCIFDLVMKIRRPH